MSVFNFFPLQIKVSQRIQYVKRGKPKRTITEYDQNIAFEISNGHNTPS